MNMIGLFYCRDEGRGLYINVENKMQALFHLHKYQLIILLLNIPQI